MCWYIYIPIHTDMCVTYLSTITDVSEGMLIILITTLISREGSKVVMK